MTDAFTRYAADVRASDFPTGDQSYSMKPEVLIALNEDLNRLEPEPAQ